MDQAGEQRLTAELARAEAFALPLESIDVTKPRLFQDDTIGYYFERLRREDRKSTRLNSSHLRLSRMPSSA